MIYGQDTTEPQGPPPPPAQRTRLWMVVALVGVLAAAGGGIVTFLLIRPDAAVVAVPDAAVVAPTTSPGPSASVEATLDVDVCAMLDPDETDRLVPQAEIKSRSFGDQTVLTSYISETCTWANRDISYKETRRMREITLDVTQYEGVGTTTAAKGAMIHYDSRLRSYTFASEHPTKERYQSKPVMIPGVGEQAVVSYQWTQAADARYAFGEGIGRIGGVTFEVKYQASQQDKEAGLFSTDTKQSVTEENALREVKNLLTQASASITAWKAKRPLPYAGKPRSVPTPTPTPTPVPIVLPASCVTMKPLAAKLVPGTEGAAARSEEGKAKVTDCQWWNDMLPAKPGTIRWRNLRATIRAFPDAASARYYLIDRRSRNAGTSNSSIGGLSWGKLDKFPGLGQDAFGYTIKQRTDTAHIATYTIYVLDGKNVVSLLFGGSDRPTGTPINSSKTTLMNLKEATEGATSAIRSVLGALDD
ncbi:hypothetical protein [Streptosporangium sp. 'caverna']|uniref:hypothetical protein n=1 Tax=Streptosporangium sp. 'caverna' TaxID=2202249 RepID=UPI000D7E70BF|nr:hypothetical protein [Streptosporangium sp. 'caverna']AWS44634.1 hypothetical protein DKM19_28165 [Streptosporangium sp. 'caverna']